MIKNEKNRAKHLQVNKQFIKGVSLVDIDTVIAEYMTNTVIPDVVENGQTIKVPMIYGNAERWAASRKEGYLRDKRGKIQIPLVMFKRNSIDRNASMPFFNENLFIPTWKKYSNKNRYDRFSLINNNWPIYELYNVRIPEYVTLAYDVVVWTNYTEHMNKIVEAFQWATDRYWGTEDGYRFQTQIDSFSTQQEVGEGSERAIRTEFTLAVNAYLLPEHYADIPLVKKEYSIKRVVVGVETDITDQRVSRTTSNQWQDVIDFIGTRGSEVAQYIDNKTFKLIQVSVPEVPSDIGGTFNEDARYSVYINGMLLSSDDYDAVYNESVYEVVFTITNIELEIDETNEIIVSGKFEVL